MTIDAKYLEKFVNVTSKAAIASYFLVGKKDKLAADKAAVDAMRTELNKLDMHGKVVIGEGSLDKAPMLYTGEILGNKKEPKFDIAVDPLEGTNFAANNLPGALTVIAVANESNLFNAPETYMNKISANLNERGVVDLDFSIKKNIYNLSEYKNKRPSMLTVCLLDRPRHKKIIDKLNALGVKLKLITDGDVSGALLVTNEKYNVDLFLGIGGGPEGVLAASALDTFNCFFQGKFLFDSIEEKEMARNLGIKDFNKKYELNEIVSGDSIFCATGITSGDIVGGIKKNNNEFELETFVTHKSMGIRKIIKTKYKI